MLFVVDHDLARTDRQTLLELASLGKRLIVVLNKKDRFTEEDRAQVLTKLRERLEGIVLPGEIVAVAAHPTPVPVQKFQKSDGTTETVLEAEAPALEALEDRLAAILESEGNELRAGNVLLRSRLARAGRGTEWAS